MGNLQKHLRALLSLGEAEGVTWPSVGRPHREQGPAGDGSPVSDK